MQLQRSEPGLWDWFCHGLFAGFLVAYSWLILSLVEVPEISDQGPAPAISAMGDPGRGHGRRSSLYGLPKRSQRAKNGHSGRVRVAKL
jgi:hypothetical protein